ncbi:MAG: cobalt-precorrin 5A hydrolase [Lachnospiraceae bacterium]
MKLSIISFTQNGIVLSENIAKLLDGIEYTLYTKHKACYREEQTVRFVTQNIGEWTREQFEERNALLFIGACGIAVRAIAPHITDKLHDSPVLVMDEKGEYVIPILSGHVGGANELAISLAKKTGAKPVITTATDINKQFAIDLFAKENGLTVVNKDGIAKVSSKVLSGKHINMSIEHGHFEKNGKLPGEIELVEYPPKQKVDVVVTSENRKFDTTMLLEPKKYAIGIGCKKGKEADRIEDFIMNHLQRAGITPMQVFGMASIDVKRDEPGLLAWSRKGKIPFITYTAEELKAVKGDFHRSEFVKEQVGVDNVCERAAMKMCEPGGRLIYEKHAEDGMTIAIAGREWRVHFDEE